MRASANIATYPGEGRLESLVQVVKSIYDQFDIIRIYFNEYDKAPAIDDPDKKINKILGPNYTDNGKFFGLEDLVDEPEYYFTMDDDLIYPPDYREKTVQAIKTYGIIITYHGRRLLGIGMNYYRGHKSYRCLDTFVGNIGIDVPGTGVTAFSTKYFCPRELLKSDYKLMSDLVFGYAAARQRKKIGLIEHEGGWIKHLNHKETIFDTESVKDLTNQNHLADEIYQMNHGN